MGEGASVFLLKGYHWFVIRMANEVTPLQEMAEMLNCPTNPFLFQEECRVRLFCL